MKFVIQRVSSASVEIKNEPERKIKKGLLIYVAVIDSDTTHIAKKMADKTMKMRIFPDKTGKMNLSLLENGYSCLVISQFTLYADCKKGNRPFYGNVAKPENAVVILQALEQELKKNCKCLTGTFGADMKIKSENDGPVTIILDSKDI